MKVAVVAREEDAFGFMLTGIREIYSDPGSVRDLLNRGDVAIVFYQNELISKLDRKTLNRVRDSVQPIFVPLEGEEGIAELMKKVMGFEVK